MNLLCFFATPSPLSLFTYKLLVLVPMFASELILFKSVSVIRINIMVPLGARKRSLIIISSFRWTNTGWSKTIFSFKTFLGSKLS